MLFRKFYEAVLNEFLKGIIWILHIDVSIPDNLDAVRRAPVEGSSWFLDWSFQAMWWTSGATKVTRRPFLDVSMRVDYFVFWTINVIEIVVQKSFTLNLIRLLGAWAPNFCSSRGSRPLFIPPKRLIVHPFRRSLSIDLLLQIDNIVLYAIKRGLLARRLGEVLRKHSNIWAHEACWNRPIHLLILILNLAEVITVFLQLRHNELRIVVGNFIDVSFMLYLFGESIKILIILIGGLEAQSVFPPGMIFSDRLVVVDILGLDVLLKLVSIIVH